jgi:sec-independent protein translocase protein TatC
MSVKGDPEKVMSLLDHLEELRRRLIVCGISMVIFTVVSYLSVEEIRTLFIRPVGQLVYLGLADALMANMRLSLAAGFFLSLPVIFYQLWLFVLPGLHRQERGVVLGISLLTLLFFMLGVAFAFFVILPVSVHFFLGFAGEGLTPMISLSAYISYSMGLMLGFGLVFLTPATVLVLARLGLVSPDFLARQRMYATIIIFVLAAVLTPPDVVSQILMGVPMLLLYEFSILIARFAGKRENKAAAEVPR